MPQDNVDFLITGFPELDAALDKLRLSVQRAVLIKAVRAGSAPIVRAAKANAPQNSGKLQNEITTQLMTSENTVDQVTIRVGPTTKAFYGSFQDRGTKSVSGKHWFTRAVENATPAALDAIAGALKTEIEKAAK